MTTDIRTETSTHTPPPYLVPGRPVRVADLVAKTTFSESEWRTYKPYLSVLTDGWTSKDGRSYPGLGGEWAHDVLPSDLDRIVEAVHQRARLTNAARDAAREDAGRVARMWNGEGAVYNAVGALRKVFDCAVRDRHLAKAFDPSRDVAKTSRPLSERLPLTEEQLREMWQLILHGGNDPELDIMMCQTILMTGARREGLINLNVRDLVPLTGMVWLDEKNDSREEQPVPDWFIQQLLSFAASRGSVEPADPVFRYRPGRRCGGRNPRTLGRIGKSRFDTLFGRLQASAAWADHAGLCAHLLRHHAYALVERESGQRVAERFARHAPDRLSLLYGRATAAEVALTMVELHGGKHPLL